MLLAGLEYPTPSRGKLILWGMLGSQPFGGMAWQVYHYLIPLRRLGFDVWYVEESEKMGLDPVTHSPTMDYRANAEQLGKFMESIGFGERWIFRPPSWAGQACFGASDEAGLQSLYLEAQGAINLCGTQELDERHQRIQKLLYLETDPAKIQVDVAHGDKWRIQQLAAHDHLFSYGENLGSHDCLVPTGDYLWHPTRPPVSPDLWRSTEAPGTGACMTTIANLTHSEKTVTWNGVDWRWSKHHEFQKFADLPASSPLPLSLALGPGVGPEYRSELQEKGWLTSCASALDDPVDYRVYIQNSLGEFSVAKEQYVAPVTGWFSDRSVCYLAAGRPVILQSTGFDKVVPSGTGLLSFSDRSGALAALESVAADYQHHCRAAEEIAREYFDADRVVGHLLNTAGML